MADFLDQSMADQTSRPAFSIVNLGCKVNRVESDECRALLSATMQSAAISNAAIVIINTCAVTGEAEKKTRKVVSRVLRNESVELVFVTGCSSALHPEWFENCDGRVLVVPKRKFLGATGLLASLWPCDVEEVRAAIEILPDDFGAKCEFCTDDHESDANFHDLSAYNTKVFDTPLRLGSGYPSRVSIKIQDGCDHECSYCVVRIARGRVWSKPREQVIAEVLAYVRAGVKEFVFTGINIGSYSDGSLAALLWELLKATHVDDAQDVSPRFRISSIEPCDVTDELIDVIAASNHRICHHLHLPLQSGDNAILQAMNRPYSAQEFASLVTKLRTAMPDISLTTDIICGFPGETDEAFDNTIAMATFARFSKIHVFPFSPREGTIASSMACQIEPSVKAYRCEQLRVLSEKLRQEEFKMHIGKLEPVVVETESRALLESYYEIKVDASPSQRGKILYVTVPDSFIDGADL